MKSNIKQCIKILKEAQEIDDLFTVQKLLSLESIQNQNLENAIKAYYQNNKNDMTMFIFGPSPINSGLGLIKELEQMSKTRQ